MTDPDVLLEQFIRGLLDPAKPLSLAAHGDGANIGPWEALTNPAVAPLENLPYAAQWVGAIMPKRLPGETDDTYAARARLELIHPRGRKRGGARSLQLVAQAYLAGDQTVLIEQYLSDDPFQVGVAVFAASVTDLAALTAAVNDNRVAIAGMLAVVEFIGGTVTWNVGQFESQFHAKTVADFEAAFDSVSDFESFVVTT